MRKKILIVLIALIILTIGIGVTYSVFSSNVVATSTDQHIAKFIFNAESSTELQLPLVDLNPGDDEEYLFAVSNNDSGTLTDIAVGYELTIKTYHLIPLVIKLYKVDGANDVLILTCDETYTRNDDNELTCTSPTQDMGYVSEKLDSYKLKVNFPVAYNDEGYSNLVDYIDVEIKSWQKVEE